MTETRDRLRQVLNQAKTIALTDEEQKYFSWMTKTQDWSNLGYWIAKVGERTGIALGGLRIAHDEIGKRLLVVD